MVSARLPGRATLMPRSGRWSAAVLIAGMLCAPPLRADEGHAPPSPPSSDVPAKRFTWRWYWDQGIRYDIELPFDDYWIGPDKGPLDRPLHKQLAFVGKIGGRLQVDAAGYDSARGLPAVGGGIQVRRLRFGTRGDFYLLTHAKYAFDFDIIGTDIEAGDAYIWWSDVPFIRSFKIGNFTPSFSLESVTSTRDLVFMETGLPVSAFGPPRSSGVEIGGPVLDERLTWSLGFARTLGTPDEGDRSTGPGRGFGRVTWLVQDDPRANQLTHVGASASLLFAADNVRYRSRPESHLAPYLVDTGTLQTADLGTTFGIEILHIHGPWLFVTEGLGASVRGAGSANFWGTYALACRSLTGEPQPYDRSQGILARYVPARPFSWKQRTWGALRAGARVSHLDLNGGPVRGGRQTDLMADLTWALNHYLLFKVETGLAFVRDRPDDGNLYLVQARLQLDFY